MRSAWLAGLGGVGAAVLGSLCCAGPLLFVFFGVGAGLASTFEPLRPFFTAAMVVSLGLGFYLVYRRRPSADLQCATGATCARAPGGIRDRVLLWSAVGLAALFWSFPYLVVLFV